MTQNGVNIICICLANYEYVETMAKSAPTSIWCIDLSLALFLYQKSYKKQETNRKTHNLGDNQYKQSDYATKYVNQRLKEGDIWFSF